MGLGAALLADKGLETEARLWFLLPAHVHLMLVGWLAQFAMGVGYWMFPRFGGGAHRGRTWPAAAAFACLNSGLLLTLTTYLLRWAGTQAPGLLLWVAGALQAVGAVAYAFHAWPRIKPLESVFDPQDRSLRTSGQ
jgi:cytochrome bd-type quinol oxidase subunit 2